MEKPIIIRRPVLNKNKELIAYELLYQNKRSKNYKGSNFEYTTDRLNEDFRFVEENNLSDGKKIFIEFDNNLFKGEVSELIFKDQIGVEISYQLEQTNDIIKGIKELKNKGSLIILDNPDLNNAEQPLIGLADIVKIDFNKFSLEKLQAFISMLKEDYNKDLSFLAENIDDYKEFNAGLEVGFDYFQGRFFTKPDVVTQENIPGYKINYLNFLKELNKEEFDFEELEKIIKNDMSMSASILKMINSAYYGYKVSSITQATKLLGFKGLKKWSLIYFIEGLHNDKPDILFVNTLTRAKFAESLAESFNIPEQSSDLFTMGMFSMMDAFTDQPLLKVLKDLPLTAKIKIALVKEKGELGEVLKLVKAFEAVEWDKINKIQKDHSLEAEKIYNKYLTSVDFAYGIMNTLLSEG
ncbi:MAG: EAL and HDOD domain-containing protein [Halanaerobium sp.]